MVNLKPYFDTPVIILFLFLIYPSVIVFLHLTLIGKLIMIFVEMITYRWLWKLLLKTKEPPLNNENATELTECPSLCMSRLSDWLVLCKDAVAQFTMSRLSGWLVLSRDPVAQFTMSRLSDWLVLSKDPVSQFTMSRLSDRLVLSTNPVAQFTDVLIEIANKTIPKPHVSKNKLPKTLV